MAFEHIASTHLPQYTEAQEELADIISLEASYHIGKSGINHHFIKIKKLVEQHKNSKNY